MECIALFASLYLGTLLYRGESSSILMGTFDTVIFSAVFLLILISVLTPGFFSQIKVISYMKQTFDQKAAGIIAATITMTLIVISNSGSLDARSVFVAAILSACIGISVTQVSLFSKYWRFLIRSGVN